MHASYDAKRVMITAHKSPGSGDVHLKPLTTHHSSGSRKPILTSCTCPTLHHLARQAIDHLPGKTLAQIRNEMDTGVTGSRSSVAFRHTVLRENVMPAISLAGRAKFGIAKSASSASEASTSGAEEMNSTERHGHCYDLVEDSLLSMINERMPRSRYAENDGTKAAAWSPTLGGYFRVYDPAGRNNADAVADDMTIDQDESGESEENDLSARHEASDWRRRSPSSFFLFGGDHNSSSSLTGIFLQHAKESINSRLFGDESKVAAGRTDHEKPEEEQRPATDYLQLLDLYGDEMTAGNRREEKEISAVDDWVYYVDQMETGQTNRPSTA